jgi:predicted RNA binding protein YcfA (HicA-like mRNA interferase family)
VPRLKRLAGRDVVTILRSFEFREVATRGSHVKLRRTVDAVHQALTIPLHRELATGTLLAIYRQSIRDVSELELRRHFYDA